MLATTRKRSDEAIRRRSAPATDKEAREDQLISLAVNAAERELLKENPSNQIVLHYLKLGTTRMQLEKEKLRRENILLESKANAIEVAARTEEMYANAIRAMRMYQGRGEESDDSYE